MTGLVGRDGEYELLRQLLDEARAGRGSIAVVMGEAGAGKTALLQSFATDAEQEATVAWGDSYEGEGAQAYWPWLQVLGALHDPARLAHSRSAIESLQLAGGTNADRFMAFARVADALKGDTPLVIVLDDLHWTDGASLALLEFVAPLVRRLPVLLAVGTRPASNEALDATLGTLLRRGARRIELRPLATQHIATVLAETGADASLAPRVRAATGGNAMFVTEVARHLASGGSPSSTPSSLTALLRSELRRLSSGAQRLAAVCAVLDGVIDPLLANAVAQSGTACFEELGDAGMLELQPNGYVFRHDTIRDAIRAGMTLADRRQLDAAIATEAGARGDTMLVAVHGCRAGDAWDPVRAHDAAVQQRDLLAGRFAVEAAVRMSELARLVRPRVALSPAQRLELMVVDGELATATGQHDVARAILRESANLARDLGASDALARVALIFGLGYEHGNAFDAEVIALLREVLDRQPAGAHANRARLLARLAWQELSSSGVSARDRLSAEALSEARMSEDSAALATALNARCWGLVSPRHLEERRAAAAEALLAARDAGDIDLELGALMWRFRSELEAGDVPAARAAADAFDGITTIRQLPYHRWCAHLFRATLAAMDGRFTDARAAAREIDPAATTQEVQAQVNAVTLTHEIEVVADEAARADALRKMSDYLTTAIGLGWVMNPHAVALERGRDAGRVALAESLAIHARAPMDEDWLAITTALAAAAILCDDKTAATQLYELLRPYSTSWVVVANGASCRGPVCGFLAGLAAVLGRPGEEADYREMALEAIETNNVPGLRYWMTLAPLPGSTPPRRDLGLTPREVEVLSMLARGHTNNEIADRLVLSVRTVQRHVENVYGRLGVHTRAAATLAAVDLGLVAPGDARAGDG